MGWWQTFDNVIGDRPADIFGIMFDNIAQNAEEEGNPKPTLEEVLSGIKLALNQNPGELVASPEIIAIKKIVARVEDKPDVESDVSHSTVAKQLALTFRPKFEAVTKTYQESFGRKPKLSEMLESIIFVLNPEEHLLVEPGTFIFEIRAEVEEGTITPAPQPEEATIPPPLEEEITFSWTEIGDNNIISHEAINLLKQPFMALAQAYEQERGELPTVKELVDGLTAVFVQNLEEFCADGESFIVQSLTIELNGDPYGEIGSSYDVENTNPKFVLQLKDALAKIVNLYQEKWQRLPQIQELLETIKLFLIQEPLHKYFSVRRGRAVEDVLISLRKRLPSPWTDIGNNEATHYDAIDVFEEAFKGVAQTYSEERGQFPSLEKLLDYITTVLRNNLGEICDNSQEISVQRLVLRVKHRPNIVSDGGGLSPDDPLVIACRDALASLSPIYQSQWDRQPRLREFLITLASTINISSYSFLSDADQKIYVEEIVFE